MTVSTFLGGWTAGQRLQILVWMSLAFFLVSCGAEAPGVELVGIEVSPAAIALEPAGTQAFAATGLMSDASTSSVAVSWSATGGTITSGGVYTAGATDGSFRVIATTSDGEFADTSAVTISTVPPDLVAVELTPPTVTLDAGDARQFTAVGRLSNGSTITIPINWTATGGTISATGLYTAGDDGGAWRVIAAAADGEHADTSSVTVVALASVEVTPATVTLEVSESQQFTATAHMTDGSTRPAEVAWTATGGSVTTGGSYTAGAVPGEYEVIASADGGDMADTAAVTIAAGGPTLIGIEITPDSVRILHGAAQQFTAVGRLSDGGTAPVAVTWSTEVAPGKPNPNTIDASGLFRAGNPIGRYLITASQVGGSLTATAPAIVHSTTGFTTNAPPQFWAPVPGVVYLCTSNHFTDDGAGRGGSAEVVASPNVGVTAATVNYTNDGTPQVYADGTGEVKVYCQPVWTAPANLVGTVEVTITVTSNRPGSGIAKVFGYEDPCSTADCRASFTQLLDFSSHMAINPVAMTVTVGAVDGANIWFKNTYVP